MDMTIPDEYVRSDMDTPSGRVACWELPGAEPTVLMLHGAACDSTDWLPLIGHLCCGCRLLLMDYRGHGQSAVPRRPVVFDDLVTDAIALVEKSGTPRVVVTGHSLGGLVAMALAERRPDLVASLVLYGSPSKLGRMPAEWTRGADSLPGATQGRIDVRAADTAKRFGAENWSELWRTARQFDGRPFLERHSIRAIAVWGDRNQPRPAYDVLGYPRSLAIQHMWVEGAGHYVQIEKPAVCAHPLRRMLSQAARA